MPLAACKDELYVLQMLNLGAQDGLHIVLFKLCNLLKLVYGNEARLPVQKYRDLLKIWEAMTDGKIIYVILGAELQGKIHYAMPVKDGLYDMIGYSNQVEEARRSFKKKKGDVGDGEADLYAEDGVLKI